MRQMSPKRGVLNECYTFDKMGFLRGPFGDKISKRFAFCCHRILHF